MFSVADSSINKCSLPPLKCLGRWSGGQLSLQSLRGRGGASHNSLLATSGIPAEGGECFQKFAEENLAPREVRRKRGPFIPSRHYSSHGPVE